MEDRPHIRIASMLSAVLAAEAKPISAEEFDFLSDNFEHVKQERHFRDNYSGRLNPRNGGKSYAIVSDPTRAKAKAARKQSMKNRKKK